MNDRKRKILIITLIAITLLVILYIVYLFMGKKPATSNEQGGVFSGFSSLLSRKKTTPSGSQINPDGTPVDIGTDTTIPDTNIDPLNPGNPGNPGTINPGGVDINRPGTPGFNPLPNPGNNGTVVNPNDPGETPEDIVKIEDPTDTTKKKPCGAGLPKGVLDIICEQGGLTPYGENVNIVNFSLNDEEQAELDRLSRMFARLAPYLKTEADVSREQANQESYETFTVNANRLSRETDIEVKSSGYRGPKEVISPFLTSKEFGSKIGTQAELELLGYSGSDFKIKIWDLLGIRRGTLFGNKDDDKDKEDDANNEGFISNLADLLSGRIVSALDGFIGGPTTCPSGKLISCGSSLFERALKIE